MAEQIAPTFAADGDFDIFDSLIKPNFLDKKGNAVLIEIAKII